MTGWNIQQKIEQKTLNLVLNISSFEFFIQVRHKIYEHINTYFLYPDVFYVNEQRDNEH